MSEQQPKRRGGSNWQRGMPSPNPAGRPPTGLALCDRIRRRVSLDEMVDLVLDIARGQPTLRGMDRETGKAVLIPREMEAKVRAGEVPGISLPKIVEVVWPTTAERQRAIEFLCDRAWPQPKAVDLNVSQGPSTRKLDLSRLTDAQLDQWIALQDAMENPAEAVAEAPDAPPALPPGDPEPEPDIA